ELSGEEHEILSAFLRLSPARRVAFLEAYAQQSEQRREEVAGEDEPPPFSGRPEPGGTMYEVGGPEEKGLALRSDPGAQDRRPSSRYAHDARSSSSLWPTQALTSAEQEYIRIHRLGQSRHRAPSGKSFGDFFPSALRVRVQG